MHENTARVSPAPTMEPLIDTNAAAVLLGLAPITLAKARVRGDGPPYVKLGASVRYRASDLMSWAAARVRTSTSAATVADDVGERA